MKSNAAAPNPHRTAAARDAAERAVPDLPRLGTVANALHVLERAALPLADAELCLVAAATARSRAAGRDDPALTPFLSVAVPAIAFPRYALHVAKATGYGHEGLAVGLALMARYAVASGRGVTPLSMHRLFATCMQLGMKTASDKFVKNVYVAPLVGMTLAELNTLEVDLARTLDFGTLVTAAELTRLPEALAALPKSAPMSALDDVFVAVCAPRLLPVPSAITARRGRDATSQRRPYLWPAAPAAVQLFVPEGSCLRGGAAAATDVTGSSRTGKADPNASTLDMPQAERSLPSFVAMDASTTFARD